MQLQKFQEQYQNILKSVVVQHKIGAAMVSLENRTKHDLHNKLKWFILHIFKLFRKSLKIHKSGQTFSTTIHVCLV